MPESDYIYEQGKPIFIGEHGEHDYTFASGEPISDTGESTLVFESGAGLGAETVDPGVFITFGSSILGLDMDTGMEVVDVSPVDTLEELRIGPNGEYVYAVNDTGDVVRLDREAGVGEVLGTIGSSAQLRDIDISPDNSTVYISRTDQNISGFRRVEGWNIDSWTMGWATSVGDLRTPPIPIAADPSGEYLYSNDGDSNSSPWFTEISKIDVSDGGKVWTQDISDRIRDIEINSDGSAVYAVHDGGAVMEVDSAGNRTTIFQDSSLEGRGVSVGQNDEYAYGVFNNDTIKKIHIVDQQVEWTESYDVLQIAAEESGPNVYATGGPFGGGAFALDGDGSLIWSNTDRSGSHIEVYGSRSGDLEAVVIEDWEDNDLSYYTRDTDHATIITSPVSGGDFAMELEGTSSTSWLGGEGSMIHGALPRNEPPTPGDYFTFDILTEPGESGRFLFGTKDKNTTWLVDFWHSSSGSGSFVGPSQVVDGDVEVTGETVDLSNVPSDEFVTVEVHWHDAANVSVRSLGETTSATGADYDPGNRIGFYVTDDRGSPIFDEAIKPATGSIP